MTHKDECISFGYLSRDFFNASLLIDEIQAENLGEVKRLLEEKKVNPNVVVPEMGAAPMHFLAGMENEDFSVVVTLVALLRSGGDPNIRSEEGLTPVHIAAMWGRCRVLEVLLSNGGNPDLIDHKMYLDAEEYALKEHQWDAYGILASFSVTNEGNDLTEKDIDSHLSTRSRSDLESSQYQDVFETGEKYTVMPSDYDDSVSEDYDWIGKSMKSMPLNEQALKTIKDQRRKTKIYEYPGEIRSKPIHKNLGPELPKRNHNRSEKECHESEMYFCSFAESSFESKGATQRSHRPPPSPESLNSNSTRAMIHNNRMLCKMSRIFLFMLKKRHVYQQLK